MAGIDPSRLLSAESEATGFNDIGGAQSDAADPNLTPRAPEPGPISIRIPEIGDEIFSSMLVREKDYLPREDYLWRLRSGKLEINFRREASDWIWKAHTHYCYGPLSFCLSMNYLDRFLSLCDLHRDKAWAVQLLAVACLSIAVKIEETDVPSTVHLQVGNPSFIFEAKTIQRMELLVLSTLKWRMRALTPFAFVATFLSKICGLDPIPTDMIEKSAHVIIGAVKGVEFLRFKPSEVAAAVAISVVEEIGTVSIEELVSSSCAHVEKTRVLECIELIKDMALMSSYQEDENGGEESPNAVLEVACFSQTSDDIINLDSKRRRNQLFH